MTRGSTGTGSPPAIDAAKVSSLLWFAYDAPRVHSNG